MPGTAQLHDLGQCPWLDNITRELLTSGTLQHYIDALSVTGLTSNPTNFDHAIAHTHFYDDAIRQKARDGTSGEALFFELALEDLAAAAALFRPVHDATEGRDGWVSLGLHARAAIPNLLIKIPGTPPGLAAIEDASHRRAGQRHPPVLP